MKAAKIQIIRKSAPARKKDESAPAMAKAKRKLSAYSLGSNTI